MSARNLVAIEISTPSLVWNRAVLWSATPEQADIEFYYKTLLGFHDATVKVQCTPVPDSFNESLLSVYDRVPSKYPVHDLETSNTDYAKRQQYERFIHQLCEMEQSRAALQVFVREAAASPSTQLTRSHNARLTNSRNWVNELLHALNDEQDYEDESAADELVVAESQETPPIGWIFTPVVADLRDSRGSRIVLDAALGKAWEHRLGTDLYPDLVVSRRISTATWAFQHPTSDALVRATLEWYLASQDATVRDGISGWIPAADREISALFSTFKRIKVNERFLMGDAGQASSGQPADRQQQVYKLLNQVESRLLASSLEDPDIEACGYDIYQRYMKYLCNGCGIPKELYGAEGVHQILQRWGRSNLGFKPDVDPLLSSWTTMWHAIMRSKPTVERVQLFLRTLDAWDPIEAMVFSIPQKTAIAREWVHAFIDNETVADAGAKVRSTALHEAVKKWCLKFVPESVFPTSFTPMAIGPIFTSRGFNSVKRADGRHTVGVRLKSPVAQETVESAVSGIQTATTTTTAVTSTTVSESPEQNTVMNYFACVSTTREIHLGTL
jgi:hypothetical protein